MANRILLYTTLGWTTAARYAGGFHTAGCEVHVLAPPRAPVCYSRYVARSHSYRPLSPLSCLRAAIEGGRPELIVACDDRAIAHMLRLYRIEAEKVNAPSDIAALIVRSLGDPQAYPRIVSRAGSLAEMQARGVRVPETLSVNTEAELDACLVRIGLPAVLKSDGSWGGDGVTIVRTREQAHAAWRRLATDPSRLRSLVRALRRRDSHFLIPAIDPVTRPVCVQKFIAGRIAASAFAAQRGQVLASFHYDVLVADVTIGPPNVVQRVDSAEMDAAVIAAADCFGLTGLHGLDFIRDETGTPWLIEINPRATQGGTLPFGPGRDLPAALAAMLAAGPVERRPALSTDIVTFFPREWRRDPSSRYLREGYHDVPWDDPDVLRIALGMKPQGKPAAGGRSAEPAPPGMDLQSAVSRA
jgi:biotin carboxylase